MTQEQKTKDTNPKDAVGVRKWRQIVTVPFTVVWEMGVAMLEGARKYGRHNYRVAGVRASVYIDATMGHLMQWWEGEDIDPDSGLSHITKALASLAVMRDAMLNDMCEDDRPPKCKLDAIRKDLQEKVEDIIDRYPNPLPPYKNGDKEIFGVTKKKYVRHTGSMVVAEVESSDGFHYVGTVIKSDAPEWKRVGSKITLASGNYWKPCDKDGNLL